MSLSDVPQNLTSEIEAVLDILGLCVIADREERDVEMTEFCRNAQMLARYIAPEIVLSRRELRHWYAENRLRLRDMGQDTSALSDALLRVADPELRRLTLSAMFAISVCDYHLADEESALIALAVQSWGPADDNFEGLPPQGDLLAVLD